MKKAFVMGCANRIRRYISNEEYAFVHQWAKIGGKIRDMNAACEQTTSVTWLFMLHLNMNACVASGAKALLAINNKSFNQSG